MASLPPAAAAKAKSRTSSRRCPGVKASLKAIDRVARAQARDDKMDQINEMVAAFKAEGGDELLKACTAVLKQRRGKGQKLARGTTKPSNTPDYLIKNCLSLPTGVDLAIFTNLPVEDNKNYYYLASVGKANFHYPETHMALTDFYEWLQQHYNSIGKPLHKYPLPGPSTDFIDWELEVGIYGFKVPADDSELGPNPLLTELINRESGVTVELPKEYQCMVKDLGATWCIKGNYSAREAYLYNMQSRMQRPCASFFDQETEVPASTPSKRPRTRLPRCTPSCTSETPVSTPTPKMKTMEGMEPSASSQEGGALVQRAGDAAAGSQAAVQTDKLQVVAMEAPDDGTDGAPEFPA